MAVPMPAMCSFESSSRSRPFGSIAPNILPMKVLPPTRFAGSRRAGLAQKVKKSTSFMPIAAAPVAMIIRGQLLVQVAQEDDHGQLLLRARQGIHPCLQFRQLLLDVHVGSSVRRAQWKRESMLTSRFCARPQAGSWGSEPRAARR
jgi:hypothetical protein